MLCTDFVPRICFELTQEDARAAIENVTGFFATLERWASTPKSAGVTVTGRLRESDLLRQVEPTVPSDLVIVREAAAIARIKTPMRGGGFDWDEWRPGDSEDAIWFPFGAPAAGQQVALMGNRILLSDAGRNPGNTAQFAAGGLLSTYSTTPRLSPGARSDAAFVIPKGLTRFLRLPRVAGWAASRLRRPSRLHYSCRSISHLASARTEPPELCPDQNGRTRRSGRK